MDKECCMNLECEIDAEYEVTAVDRDGNKWGTYACQEHLIDAVDALKEKASHVDVDRLGDK